jgi:hypothetical protein
LFDSFFRTAILNSLKPRVMKKTLPLQKLLISLILVFILMGAQCNKELPPETQTGERSFGCLVNGEVFKPKGSGLTNVLTCFYQYIYNSPTGFVFALDATKEGDGCSFTSITIGADSVKLEEGKVYKLVSFGKGNVNGQFSYVLGCGNILSSFTSAQNTGELYLKKFDEANQIVAGTFWFTVVKPNGDTVRITDGRFDMKYTR